MTTISTASPETEDITALIGKLAPLLGDEGLLLDDADIDHHSTDLLDAGARCRMVIRPANAAQLAEATGLICSAGLAVAPRGGGLTYVSGYAPRDGEYVAVDLRRMNAIVEINERDMYITVEAGATWSQIYDALAARELRLPFFGTFSGRGATVGGGLSNGALFLGTARYGSAAEIVLGLSVVTAEGKTVHTGQAAVKNARKPFFRAFGPDLTGLFVHDAGALGIKATATLRMIRMPRHTDFLSFGFAKRDDAVEALSEIGRSELAEDAYVMDPDKTRAALSAPTSLAADVRTLGKVMKQEKGVLRGLKAGAKLAMAGRDFIEAGCFSMHLVLAGRHREGVDQDMKAARAVVADLGGFELPNSIPKAGRAEMFSPLDAVLGPTGDRWVALNAKVAHSDGKALTDRIEGIIADHRQALDEHKVVVSRLLTVMSNHAFSYEPVFNWHDSWLPMHHNTISEGFAKRVDEPEPNPRARELVMQIRQEIIAAFADFGAASNQIGRTYRYASILRPETRELLERIKRAVDPYGLMNPGALELESEGTER